MQENCAEKRLSKWSKQKNTDEILTTVKLFNCADSENVPIAATGVFILA